MPVQRAGPKAQQQTSVPLLGKIPWFRQPFKVVEPVNGTFLKVCCVAREFDYSSKLGDSAVAHRVVLTGPFACRLAGQSIFVHCFSCTWPPGPSFSAVPRQMFLAELAAPVPQADQQVSLPIWCALCLQSLSQGCCV